MIYKVIVFGVTPNDLDTSTDRIEEEARSVLAPNARVVATSTHIDEHRSAFAKEWSVALHVVRSV